MSRGSTFHRLDEDVILGSLDEEFWGEGQDFKILEIEVSGERSGVII